MILFYKIWYYIIKIEHARVQGRWEVHAVSCRFNVAYLYYDSKLSWWTKVKLKLVEVEADAVHCNLAVVYNVSLYLQHSSEFKRFCVQQNSTLFFPYLIFCPWLTTKSLKISHYISDNKLHIEIHSDILLWLFTGLLMKIWLTYIAMLIWVFNNML